MICSCEPEFIHFYTAGDKYVVKGVFGLQTYIYKIRTSLQVLILRNDLTEIKKHRVKPFLTFIGGIKNYSICRNILIFTYELIIYVIFCRHRPQTWKKCPMFLGSWIRLFKCSSTLFPRICNTLTILRRNYQNRHQRNILMGIISLKDDFYK